MTSSLKTSGNYKQKIPLHLKRVIWIFFAFTLVSSKCKKDEDTPDVLPAITQEGKNTFGALVNGRVLIPKQTTGQSHDKLFINYGYNGGDYLILKGANLINIPYTSILLRSTIPLEQGKTYVLSSSLTAPCYAQYNEGASIYTIAPPSSGQITINRLDQQLRIIAGTFYFDAVNKDGSKVEVREGRFDVEY